MVRGERRKGSFLHRSANFQILLTLFNFFVIVMKQPVNTALTPFQEFTLTLMRLCLNLTLLDLAHRFAVSKTTVSARLLCQQDYCVSSVSQVVGCHACKDEPPNQMARKRPVVGGNTTKLQKTLQNKSCCHY